MIKNYLKTGLRNLFKNKISFFINICGLAAGMTVAMLIGLWIYDECSFNKYHVNYDQIGQIFQQDQTETLPTQSFALEKALSSAFSDDFKYVVMSSETEKHVVLAGDRSFTQGGRYMQNTAPDLLSLRMILGTRSGLKEINSILLSQSLAKKLFGDTDPTNKVLKIDNKINVKVTGVYEDLPDNDEFKDMTYILPWELNVATNDWFKTYQNDWNSNSWLIYVQLRPNADLSSVSEKIKYIKSVHGFDKNAGIFILPMSKWHLFSTFENGRPVMSQQLKYCWFYGIIGIFVLLLACINFMNLSTARSEKRAREVGIRKTMGSKRAQLIMQFFSESLLVVFFAFIVAVVVLQLSLPRFNTIAGKSMVIPWTNAFFWIAALLFCVLTGLLAGSYPALYLSSLKPVRVLKGSLQAGRFAALPRKILIVLQFTVSVSLIIGTIIVYQQIQFAKNRPVGYSRGGLITLEMVSPELQGKYDMIQNELKNTGVVSEMTESDGELMDVGSNQGISAFDWVGKNPGLNSDMGYVTVKSTYGRTIGWKVLEGRDFSEGLSSDSAGIILNQAAAQMMGLQNPVGKSITWKNSGIGGHYKVIGLVKNMLMNSPYAATYPTIFLLKGDLNWLIIKVDPGMSMHTALPKIKNAFKKLFPTVPFDYHFVDEAFAAKFAAEERIGKLASFFAILTTVISCMGLFGLASYVAEQRTRELGIRKVLGASVGNLWGLLSTEFLKLVIIANMIAIPLTWLFLNRWLQQYEYRTPIYWWVFALSGLGALFVTLLTVSGQSLKAALANPVKSLRTD